MADVLGEAGVAAEGVAGAVAHEVGAARGVLVVGMVVVEGALQVGGVGRLLQLLHDTVVHLEGLVDALLRVAEGHGGLCRAALQGVFLIAPLLVLAGEMEVVDEQHPLLILAPFLEIAREGLAHLAVIVGPGHVAARADAAFRVVLVVEAPTVAVGNLHKRLVVIFVLVHLVLFHDDQQLVEDGAVVEVELLLAGTPFVDDDMHAAVLQEFDIVPLAVLRHRVVVVVAEIGDAFCIHLVAVVGFGFGGCTGGAEGQQPGKDFFHILHGQLSLLCGYCWFAMCPEEGSKA